MITVRNRRNAQWRTRVGVVSETAVTRDVPEGLADEDMVHLVREFGLDEVRGVRLLTEGIMNRD